MKKKLLSLILTGVMLLSAPSGAMALEFSSGEPAADEFTDEYLQEYAAASAPVQESAELPEQDLIFTTGEAEEAAEPVYADDGQDEFSAESSIQTEIYTQDEAQEPEAVIFTESEYAQEDPPAPADQIIDAAVYDQMQEEVIFLSEDDLLSSPVAELPAEEANENEAVAEETDPFFRTEEPSPEEAELQTDPLQDPDSLLTASVGEVLVDTEEQYIEAGLPADRNTLPFWESWIDKESSLYVENVPERKGMEYPLYLSNLRISDDTMVKLEDRGDVWVLRSMQKYGTVTVTLDYEEPQVTHIKGTHSFKLSISDEVYQLDLSSTDGTHRLLPGKDLELEAGCYMEAYSREEGHHMGDASDLTYKWFLPDNGADGLEIISSTTDGTGMNLPEGMSGAKATVRAKAAEPGGYPVEVAAYKNNEEVARQRFYIGVLSEYFQITPSKLNTGLGLGESMKAEPMLHSLRKEENGTESDVVITDGIFFRWYFDHDSIQIHNDTANKTVEGEATFPAGDTFTIKRMSPHYLNLHLQAVEWDQDENDWHVLSDNYLWFDDIYINLQFKGQNHPRDRRNYLLYYNESVTASIDEASISHLPIHDDLFEIRWTLGVYNEQTDRVEPREGFYTVSADGMSVTVDGTKASQIEDLRRNGGINVQADLYYNGRQYAGTGTWMELREPREQYELPCEGGRVTLPHWDQFIERRSWCYVEDSSVPQGEDREFEITSVSITGGNPEVVSLEEQPEGWYIRSQRVFGRAEFTVGYTDIHGAAKTYTFSWIVSGDEYDLDVRFTGMNNWMQPGTTIDLIAEIRHNAFSEEQGYYDGDISKVTYRFILLDEAAKNLKILSQNGGQAKIQAGAEAEGYYRIRVEAYDQASGRNDPVAVQGRDLHVQRNYWVPEAEMIPRNLKPGESFTVNPRQVSYGIDEDGNSVREILPNIRFRWYFNEDEVTIKDGNGESIHPTEDDSYVYTSGSQGENASFTLTRMVPWEFRFGLRFYAFQNGEWQECGWREYYMDRMDTRFSFKEPNRFDHYLVFDGGTVTIAVDPDSLQNVDLSDQNYRFEWLLGRNRDNKPEPDTSYGDSFYTVSPDGLSVTIDGNVLKNIPELWSRGTDVQVKLLYKDQEVCREGTFVETRNYEDELEGLYDDGMLPGWTNEYRTVSHWIRNEEHQDGDELECPIISMSAANRDPDQTDPVVSVEKDNNGTWLVHAENYGAAVVTYSYTDVVDGSEHTDEFILYVGGDWYRAWIYAEDGGNQILAGTEKTLQLDVVHRHYSDKDGETDGPTDTLRFEWILQDDGNPEVSQAVHLLPAADRLSAALKTDRGFFGNAGVEVIVYDGEDEVTRAGWWFNVQDEIDVLMPDRLNLNLKVGQSTGSFEVFRENRTLNADGSVGLDRDRYQNFRYRWEFDPDLVQITDTDGKAVGSYDKNGDYIYTPGSHTAFGQEHGARFTIKKLDHEEARITLVEQWQDGNGNYHDGHRRDYIVPYNGTHVYGAWKVTKIATALAAGSQQRICIGGCGTKQTKTIAKLKPVITVKAGTTPVKTRSTVTLKKGKSAVLTFSGLARGDAYYSVTSSNKKIATVKRSGSKITIKGVKAGKATVKLFLKSNKKTPIFYVTVKVQAGDVKTTGITIAKSFTVKVKKKITLKPVLKPFTSTQKITYSVAKKYAGIISVTSSGIVTGKKKGTGIVTVKSGTKKVNVTIKVTK